MEVKMVELAELDDTQCRTGLQQLLRLAAYPMWGSGEWKAVLPKVSCQPGHFTEVTGTGSSKQPTSANTGIVGSLGRL